MRDRMSRSGQAVIAGGCQRLVSCIVLGVAAAVFAVPRANAVPVIPGAVGFGINTPAGRGGAVHKVTSLQHSGPGSLKACVDAQGPRVCVFEVSGTIRLPGDLIVRNPNITIAGQTAPSPGIMLRGGGVLIKTSDVLMQHIHVRPGDDAAGEPAVNRDALKIEAPANAPISNIVIDHCSFSWATDELASAWQGWNNISLLNNIFAEPLNDSIHPKGPHGFGVIIGPVDGNVTMAGNLIAHTVSRNPLTNATRAVLVNNVIYNWKNMAIDLQSQSGKATHNTVVGNVFVRGPDYANNAPVSLRADANKLPAGSKVFLLDNHAQEASSDPWSVAAPLNGTLKLADYKSSAPMGWPAGLTTLPTQDNVVLDHVLKYVGARPADRDSVDKRIIEHVRTRTGGVVNCVAANGTARCNRNAGGWPAMAENRRALTVPADANSVTAEGYTKLELWLHDMSADVEGRSREAPQAPVLSSR